MPRTSAATYLRNVGKSVGYSMIKEIKNNAPAMSAFSSNNSDAIKSTYSAIRHMDKTVSRISTKVLESEYGEVGRYALKNIKEDLRSGKFYNLERIKEAEGSALTSEFGIGGDDDFGFEDLANMNPDDLDMDGGESLESMMDLVGKKASEAVSDAVIRTTEYAVNSQTELARASAEQNKAMYANLHAALGTINENVGKLIEVANGPMTTHFENSQKFFEAETKLSEERNAILKEMLELQRGVYAPKEKKAASGKLSMADIMDENGMPDLSTYFEAIKKNIDEMSGGTGDLIKQMLTPDMLKTIVASPLQYATDMMAKTIFPNLLKKSLQSFDKTISGAFSSIMAKVMNTDFESGIANTLKSIFGIADNTKDDIDTSKYEKGAVPFDGITRKSIVEVIPTYLSRIEAAITRGNERRFDFETGKFVDIDEIKKMGSRTKKNAMDSANFDVNSYINKYMKAIKFKDAKSKKELQANIDRILEQSYETGILFNPNEKDKMASDYKMKGKDLEYQLEVIRKMFAAIPKDVVTAYAKNVYEAKGSYSRTMKMKEESGTSIENALWNDSTKGMAYDRSRETQDPYANIPTNWLSKKGRDMIKRAKARGREQRSKKQGGGNKTSRSDDEAAPPSVEDAAFTFDPEDYDSLEDGVTAALMVLNDDSNKSSSKKGIMKKLQESTKLGEGVKKFIKGVDYLTHKPTEFLASVIKKADTSLYNLIFGVEYDEETDEKKSVSKAIFDGLKDTFENFKDWMRKNVFEPIKKYFDKEGTFGNRVKNFVKGKADQFKQSNFGQRFFGTFKNAGRGVKNVVKDAAGNIISNTNDPYSEILQGYAGRKVTKTGVIAASAGEWIIPQDLSDSAINRRRKKENIAKDDYLSHIIRNFDEGGEVPGAGETEPLKGSKSRSKKKAEIYKTAKKWKEKIELDPVGAREEFAQLADDEQKKIRKALEESHLAKEAKALAKNTLGTIYNAGKSVFGRAKEAAKEYRTGNPNDEKDKNKKDLKMQESDLKKIAQSGIDQIKEYAPEVAAGGIIGSGVSLITGAIGGPLVGAAVGAGISLLKHSEKFNKTLFGDVGDDGKRHGGLLPEDISQAFQKYAPSMGKGAILGGISSFILPFGPLAGIMLGSAAGFAKENQEVKDALFGEGKLFSKDFPEKVKKALPTMGAGALIGAVAGPFGLIPNLMLGSAVGLGASTEKFKELMFGKEDEDGNRHGGIIETAVKTTFMPIVDFTKNTIKDLTQWASDNIKKPLIEAIDPLKKQVKIIFESIHQGLNKLFEDHLGATFDKLLEKWIFKPVTGFIKKVTGMALAPIKFVVSAPFKLIGAVGNSLRNRQIRRGQADYMTADQRLAFREKRGRLRNIDLMGSGKKWRDFDVAASDVSAQEAGDIADNIEFALNKNKALEASKKNAYKTYTEKVRKHKKLDAGQVNAIAKSIKDYVEKGKGTPEQAAKKAHQKIAMFKGLNESEKKALSQAVDEFIGSIQEYKSRAEQFGNNREALLKALNESETFNGLDWTKYSDEDLKKIAAMLRKEQDAKTVKDGETTAKGVAGTIPTLNEEQEKRHTQLMDLLKPIRDDIASLVQVRKDEAEENGRKLNETYERDKEKRENAFTTKFANTTKEVFSDIKDTIVSAISTGMDKATHNRLVGNNRIDFMNPAEEIVNKAKGLGKRSSIWTPKGEVSVGQAAAGIDRVSKTGIVAVSEGEMIIPPDMNPFNISKRKREEDKAKKDFANSIFGFAEGGEVGGDSAESATHKSFFDRLKSLKANKDEESNVRYEFSNGRVFRFIRNSIKDKFRLDKSDADTAEALQEEEEEAAQKKSFFKTMTDIPKSFLGSIKKAFNGEEKEDKKGGILGKMFSIFGGGDDNKSGLIGKSIAAIIGIPLLTGMLADFFTKTEAGKGISNMASSLVDKLGLGEKLDNVVKGVTDWFQGDVTSGGLPQLLANLASHWATGMDVLATKVIPKFVELLVKALPGMLTGVVRGLGAIITENFHNAIHGGSGSESLKQADQDYQNAAKTISIQDLKSSHGSELLSFNGSKYKGEQSFGEIYSGWKTDGAIDTATGKSIKMPELATVDNVAKSKIDEAKNYVNAQGGDPNSDAYKKTSSYQNLSDGMKSKLDKQIADMTKKGENYVSITDANGNTQYMTIQQLLASDTPVDYIVNTETGETKTLTGKDILNNPEMLGSRFGLDWQLTDEERQRNKEEKGLAKTDSIATATLGVGARKFLQGRTGTTGLGAMGKAAKHIPIIGRPLSWVLKGADKVTDAAGWAGQKIMPDILTGKYSSKKVAEQAKKNAEKAATKGTGKGLMSRLRGSQDTVRTLNSATGETMTRGEAIRRGLSEEAGDFTVEKQSKLGSLGEKLGLKTTGEVAEGTTEKAAKKGLKEAVENSGKKQSSGLIKKITDWVTKHIVDLKNNSTIFNTVSKGLAKAGKACSKEAVDKVLDQVIKAIEKQLLPTFVEKLAKAGAKTIAKIAGSIASGGIVALIFGAAGFIGGYNDAETILGVVKDDSVDYDPSFGVKLACGLVSFINETFLFGLVPLDVAFNILYEVIKVVFNIDPEDTAELDKARAESQKFMEEYNLKNDTNMTVTEYNDSQKWTHKAWNAVKSGAGKAWDGIKTGASWIADKAGGLWDTITGKKEKDEGKEIEEASGGKLQGFTSKQLEQLVKDYNKENKTNLSTEDFLAYVKSDDSFKKTEAAPSLRDKVGNVASSAINGIKNAGSAVASGVKTFAGGVVDIAQTVGTITSNSFNWALGKSDQKAADQINENTEENPMAGFEKLFASSTDMVFTPLRGIVSLGKGIANIVKKAVGWVGDVINQVKTFAEVGAQDFNEGNFAAYFSFGTSEAESTEGSPLSPFLTFLKATTRIIQFPILGIKYVGGKIVDGIKNIINGAKQVFTTIGSSFSNTLNIAMHGSLSDYFNIQNTGNVDTGFGWLDTSITAVSRILLAGPAAVIGMGRAVWNGIKGIIDGAKTVIGAISSNVGQTLSIAAAGDLSSYFDFSNGTDESMPFSWLNTGITGITRIMMAPVSLVTWAGSNIKSFVTGLLDDGKTTLTNISKDILYVNKYHDKDSLDGYWTNENNTSDGLFGVIETVAGAINRVINFPIVMIKQIVGKISDFISAPVNWIKDKLGDAKDAITNFFGGGEEEKNDNGEVSKLGSAGGSGLRGNLSKMNGRGAQQKPKSDSKYADDPTFVSQLDSKYANQKFNVQGDTEKQTIADSGCGPAAAAMVVNGAYGQNQLDMETASKEALKYKVKNGGVNAAYFEDTFSSHGLMTKYYLNGSKKQRNEEISSSLMSGNRVVLMGSDRSNQSKVASPYGPDDHYIVATRMSPDGKYIWVNDPESKVPEVKYPAANILNNTKMGVAGVAANGSRLMKHIHAKGSGLSTKMRNVLRRYHGRGKYGPDTIQYKVWDGLRSAGFSENATAAAMGNIQHESGFNPSAIEKGSGAGFGLIQWTGGRRTAIENYAAQKGVSASDIGLQIEYLIKELRNETGAWSTASSKYGFGALTQNDWQNGDLDTATKAFMACFERPSYDPSINHIDRRLQSAREYYAEFTGTQPSGNTSTSGDSSSSGGSILDDILGVFDSIGEIWGLKKKDSSGSSGGSVGSASSLQGALVEKMKSVEGKLAYSQSSRNPDNGSGDCSSTVQWAYKNVLGVDPGSWTGAQETDSDTYTVTSNFDESQMQPGDLILYNGHVEMYAGNGQMIGHGGGSNGTTPGPTIKPLDDQGRFRMVRRWVGFRDGYDKNSIPEQYRSLAGKGSGLSRYRSSRAIDPKKTIKIDNTYKSSNQKLTQNGGFVRRSRYTANMAKDMEIPAGMYAAGTGMEIDGYMEQGSVPTGIPNTSSSSRSSSETVIAQTKAKFSGNKVQAYLAAILKLLAKEVENTAMLSTVVTILTELVKISEEERALKGKSNTEQKQQELNTRRMSMMNILKSTGIADGSSPELDKLIAEAQRIAAI